MISDGFGVTLASSVELFEPWDPLGTIPSVDLGDFLTARTALTVRSSPRQKIKMADLYFPTLRLIFVPLADRSFLGWTLTPREAKRSD